MRGHTDRAEAQMAVHVEALTKPVGQLIDSVLRKHHRAVLEAVKELHDRCTKAESLRDELAEALRYFQHAKYAVSTEIDERGYRWSDAYLDQAIKRADAILARIDAEGR